MSIPELIAIREAARRLHVSDTAIRKAIADGRLTQPADEDRNPDNGRPRLRWPLARDEFVRNSETSKRSHVGSQGGASRAKDYAAKPEVRLPTSDRMDEQPDIGGEVPDAPGVSGGSGPKSGRDGAYNRARAAREVYRARNEKIDLDEREGRLVSVDAVRVEAFRVHRQVRDSILTIPDRCSHELAAMTEPNEVHAYLLRQLNDALRKMAADIYAPAA